MNVQMAVQGEDIFVIEVNPRASRTVPFVSKCVGVSLAKIAARVMAGRVAGRGGLHAGNHPAVLQRQGSGVPVRQVPRASTRSSARR